MNSNASIKKPKCFKSLVMLMLALSLLLVTLPRAYAADPVSLDPWNVTTISGIYFMGAAYGNNMFVAVGDGNPPNIRTSSNGLTWTRRATSIGAPNFFTCVAWCNGLFLVVGNNGLILTSPDGINWTERNWDSTTQKRNLLGVAYGNGMYVATGVGGTVWTSTDSITWTKSTISGVSDNLYEVTYGNGIFVAVGGNFSNSTILTSPDGSNWTRRYTGTGERCLYGINYVNGAFIAAGANGIILTSTDGTDWTPRISGTTSELCAVTYGCGIYMAAGDAGTILTSTDMETWTPRNSGTSNRLEGAACGNYRFCAAGVNSILSSASLRPTMIEVIPDTGPTAGGTTVEITGLNLSETDAVYFGDIAATSFTVNSNESITAVSPPGEGPVFVTVHSPDGTSDYTVRFTYADLPTLTGPASQTVMLGDTVTFTVAASGGTEPLSYRWRRNGSNIPNGGRISGARTATLTITNAQLSDAGSYTCAVSNAAGSVTSSAATLTVNIIDASFSPDIVIFDPDNPADVSTEIIWGSAQSVSGIVYGSGTAVPADAYSVQDDTLTVESDFLESLNLSDGDSVQLTVSFDVGSSAVLTITAHVPGKDATLIDLTAGGVTVNDFSAEQYEYTVELPYGTEPGSAVALVGAAASDTNASISITQAAGLPGDATVTVTSEDGNTTHTYTIHFTLAAPPAYALTIIAGTGGSIATGAGGNYEEGAVINITATAYENYRFNRWTATGGAFGNANSASTTFTMPAGPVTVTAVFSYDGDIPSTGDSGSNVIWWLLSGASAAGIVTLAVSGRRRRQYRR